MKQICILCITLAVIIGLNIFQNTYLDRSGENLKNITEEIILCIEKENYSMLNNKINKLEENWEKDKSIWDVLTEHDDVEEVESSIASLKAYAKIQIKSESLNECFILKQRIEHILENEKVSLSNIF
ncbi:MAG: DUF4363 family protein [Clostridia bacterium]|nr:DUF4363 family protein [Clostridia bacterium]